jgi:nicotinamide riboside kinase
MEYDCQREILMGRHVTDAKSVNFLEKVPDAIKTIVFSKMTARQRPKVQAMLQAVSMHVLPVLGPAGKGKSTLMALIMLLLIVA